MHRQKLKPMKTPLVFLALILPALAQSTCPAPTPGVPHVCLTWVASVSTGVTGYNVYRATAAGGENYATPLNSAPVTSVMYYDTTDVVGTTYYYTVTAIGTGGVMSAPSLEVSAQIPVPPSAPTTLVPKID